MKTDQNSLFRIFRIKIISQITASLLMAFMAVVQVARYKTAVQIDLRVLAIAYQQKALTEKAQMQIAQILRTQEPEAKTLLLRQLSLIPEEAEKNHRLLIGAERFPRGEMHEVSFDLQKEFYGNSGLHQSFNELMSQIKILTSNPLFTDLELKSSSTLPTVPAQLDMIIPHLEKMSQERQDHILLMTLIFATLLGSLAIGLNLLFSRWAYREAQGLILDLQSKCHNLEMDNLSMQDREGLIQLGQVTGGLIHEIKNPLTVIFGLSEQGLKKLNEGELKAAKMTEILSSVLRNSRRINETLEAFRSLNQSVSRAPMVAVGAKKILTDAVALTQEQVQKMGVQIEIAESSEDGFVSCRETDIHQVLKVLIENATEAVAKQKSPWIRVQAMNSGNDLHFCVTDSGEGIPTAHREQLFKPFFSTKAQSGVSSVTESGVGLGLNLAERILRAHSCKIWLDTHHSNTRFVFNLPKAKTVPLIGGPHISSEAKAA